MYSEPGEQEQVNRTERFWAAALAALSMCAVCLLPAECIVSRETLSVILTDRYMHSPPPGCLVARDEGSGTPKAGTRWNEPVQGHEILVATGHFTNETRLDAAALASIYAGTIDRWDRLGWETGEPIWLYSADGDTIEEMGLPAGRVTMLATWDDVVKRIEETPGSLALLPVETVGPTMRVLSAPLYRNGREAPALPVQTLTVAGDIMLGNWIQTIGRIRLEATGERGYPFTHIAPLLHAADLAVANLEFVASDGPRKGNLFNIQFRARQESLDSMREAGIDLVSLANNHTCDYGETGFLDMINTLEALGLRYAGAGTSTGRAYAPARFQIGTSHVAFVALTDIPPNQCPARNRRFTIADTRSSATGPAARMARSGFPHGTASSSRIQPHWKEAIQDARVNADLVVVLVHWGEEFKNEQDGRQRTLAHTMVSLGADLVLGAHPHCVQGIEMYKGGIIVYSLGNLVFALNEIPGFVGAVSDGVLLQCRILGNRLYQIDVIPALEVMGEPIPVPAGCQDPVLSAFRKRTLRRIYENSRFSDALDP